MLRRRSKIIRIDFFKKYSIIIIENKKGEIIMYRVTNEKKQIQQLVYQNTPIDVIVSTRDLPNGIEVIGYAGTDTLTYRFYDNGVIVER